MRTVVAYSFEDVRVREQPAPTAGPGEAVIRVLASGLCTSDCTKWYIDAKAKKHGGFTTLGHEAMGEVVEVGPSLEGAAPRFRVGDRIVPHHHAPCLQPACPHCRRREYVQCPTWKATGFDPGGLAELMRVTATSLANDTQLVPDGLANEDAALTEPVGCCVKAVAKCAGLRSGETLAIIGLGVMGTLNLRVAKALHDGPVIGVDLVPWRLQHALDNGADHVIDASPGADAVAQQLRALTGGVGPDSIIVGPGRVDIMRAAIAAGAPGGTVCFFMTTPPGERMEVTPFDLYFREQTLTHSYSCGPDDTRRALELITAGHVTAGHVVTETIPLADLPAAYPRMGAGGDRLKTMVLPQL